MSPLRLDPWLFSAAGRLIQLPGEFPCSTRFTVRSDVLTRAITGGFVIKHKGVTYAVTGTKEGREREDVIEITTAARPDRPKDA